MHAYFDCFSGISGDMTLGALMDLGVPVEWLQKQLQEMPLSGFALSLNQISKNAISAQKLDIRITEDQHHRHYADIKRQIQEGRLPDRVKKIALDIFDRLAEVESSIHDCEKDTVHFHEVGALDSIIDIIGTALCIDYLDIKSVSASKIPMGTGFVKSQHGMLPVPAPATIALLKGLPVYGTGVPFELVTPTGAAIIASLAERFTEMPAMDLKKIGYGAGFRDLDDRPNCLRILCGNLLENKGYLKTENVVVVETCIDDMSPELCGYVMEQLFEDGALDVFWIPVQMKKNRPGVLLTALCDKADQTSVVHRILTETTSIGVRVQETQRRTLFREIVQVNTRFGDVAVKRIRTPDGSFRAAPEYEICRKIALEKDLPLRQVYAGVLQGLYAEIPET